MPHKRLLHLSDIHLPNKQTDTLLGTYPWHRLQQVIEAITQLQPRPDAIIVSGDIAEHGSEQEYLAFLTLLEPLNITVHLLAGNHDDSDVMKDVLDGGLCNTVSPVDIGSWQLLLINSQVAGASHGHVSHSEMQRLDETLSANKGPAIVALHHTPVSPCADPDCQLANHEEFLALLQSHGNVKIVLAGHTHQADKTATHGLQVFTAPSTFAQVSHPATVAEVNTEDFFAAHTAELSRVGFRVFDLYSDGRFDEQLHWLGCQ